VPRYVGSAIDVKPWEIWLIC